MNDEWNVTMRDKNPTLKNVTKSLGTLPETFKYGIKCFKIEGSIQFTKVKFLHVFICIESNCGPVPPFFLFACERL